MLASRHALLATLLLAVAACTPAKNGLPTPVGLPTRESPPPAATTKRATPVPKVAPRTSIEGTVLAPASVSGPALIGNDGGALIGSDGATLIGDGGTGLVGGDGAGLVGGDGAGLVASHAGRYALLAAGGPIANATVVITDATGKPLPGVPRGKTDAKGRYRIANVPVGYTFRVVVPVQTAKGRVALQTLVRPAQGVAEVPISAGTTVMTVAVAKAKGPTLGTFDAASFDKAAKAVGVSLETSAALDDGAAIAAKAKALAEATDEVGQAIAKLAKEIEASKPPVEEFLEAVKPEAEPSPAASTDDPSPGASPTFAPVPGASVSASEAPAGESTKRHPAAAEFQSGQGIEGWSYLYRIARGRVGEKMFAQTAAAITVWSPFDDKECQITLGTDRRYVVMRTGKMGRSPELAWKAPANGEIAVAAGAGSRDLGAQAHYEVAGTDFPVDVAPTDYPQDAKPMRHPVKGGELVSFVTDATFGQERTMLWQIQVDFTPR